MISAASAYRILVHAVVKHRVKAADFLPRKKPGHLPFRIPPDALGRIAIDVEVSSQALKLEGTQKITRKMNL